MTVAPSRRQHVERALRCRAELDRKKCDNAAEMRRVRAQLATPPRDRDVARASVRWSRLPPPSGSSRPRARRASRSVAGAAVENPRSHHDGRDTSLEGGWRSRAPDGASHAFAPGAPAGAGVRDARRVTSLRPLDAPGDASTTSRDLSTKRRFRGRCWTRARRAHGTLRRRVPRQGRGGAPPSEPRARASPTTSPTLPPTSAERHVTPRAGL